MRRLRILSLLVLVGVLAACGGGVSTDELQGVALAEPTPKPDFTLTDTDGNPFHFAEETEGKLTLLYFGYTHCPDVCGPPGPDRRDVRPVSQVAESSVVVFVTVDPERDTPEVLRSGWTGSILASSGSPALPRSSRRRKRPPGSRWRSRSVRATTTPSTRRTGARLCPDGLLYAQYRSGPVRAPGSTICRSWPRYTQRRHDLRRLALVCAAPPSAHAHERRSVRFELTIAEPRIGPRWATTPPCTSPSRAVRRTAWWGRARCRRPGRITRDGPRRRWHHGDAPGGGVHRVARRRPGPEPEGSTSCS